MCKQNYLEDEYSAINCDSLIFLVVVYFPNCFFSANNPMIHKKVPQCCLFSRSLLWLAGWFRRESLSHEQQDLNHIKGWTPRWRYVELKAECPRVTLILFWLFLVSVEYEISSNPFLLCLKWWGLVAIAYNQKYFVHTSNHLIL